MSDRYIFRVQVLEGRGFGEDPQTLLCCAQFAGESKTTQYSVNTNNHIWNSTLNWSISREELRKAQASGSTHCKISVLRKDGTRLGWVVVSLRSAKLQSQYRSDPTGQWLQLNASKLADPPQLRITYALCEERLLSQLDQPLSAAAQPATASSSFSGTSSASADASLRRVSSSSAAAASLRPSKSLSGKKRLSVSAAVSDISSTAGEQETEGAAAEAMGTAADAGNADNESPRPATPSLDIVPPPEIVSAAAAADSIKAVMPVGVQEQQPQQQEPPQAADASALMDMQTAEVIVSQEAANGTHSPTSQSMAAKEAEATPEDDTNGTSATVAADKEAPGPEVATVSGRSDISAGVEHAATDELVAAAEARLPSFAQRRQQQQQQQQLQQARELLEQQQQSGQQQQEQQQEVRQSDLIRHTQSDSVGDSAALRDAQISTAAIVPADENSNSRTALTADAPETHPRDATAEGRELVPAADAALGVVDPVRQFVLTLDVRSFQAGRRLPVALAATYVTAFLPQELIGFLTTTCGAKLPPKLAPLRTLPAVDVLRGSEGALPNGCASVSFSAGVVGLAGLLAQEPRVVLEVWHKEKLRSDMLLGVASVSLSALLQECWVDGHAPVYALMTKASGAQDQEEKVQVGLLRVVLSLEDKGPPTTTTALASPTVPNSSRHQQRSSSINRSPLRTPDRLQRTLTPSKQIHAPNSTSSAAAAAVAARPYAQRQQQLQHELTAAEAGRSSAAAHPAQAAVSSDKSAREVQEESAAAAIAAGVALPPGNYRQMPEYMVAWELEVWKRAEEARFRAQLKELEQQRMSVIEAQWWKRERGRESEVAAIKAEYARLEQQTKGLLASVQEREVKLVAAEGDLKRRQVDLERQQAARMSEAEAAVRRLQVECEHQLSLERDRTAAVARQRDAAESRLLAAEARAAAMEAQFMEYRAAQRATPEAQLQVQLQEAQTAAAAAQARAAKAATAKKHYKEQVLQLARELAALHQQRQQELQHQQQKQQEEAKAKEQSSIAAVQAAELSGLREQLAALRSAAMAAAAADSPTYPHSPASSDRSWHHQQQQHRHRRHQRKLRQRYKSDKENDPLHDHQQRQQQQQGKGKQGVQEQQPAGPQQSAQSAGGATGDSVTDEEQFSGDEQQGYSSSASGSRQASDSEGYSGREGDGHHAAISRRAKLQKLQKQRHIQKQQGLSHGSEGKGSAAAPIGPEAAADAALAEVAALADILNQPRHGTEPVQVQQQQQQRTGTGQPVHPVDEALQGSIVAAEMRADAGTPQPQQQTEDGQQLLSPQTNPLSEVRRLLKEKVELLASGLYGKDDAVILQIDARVQALAERQLAA